MYYRRENLNDFVRSPSNASITSWQPTQHTQCANYEWHETRDREIVWSLGEGELTILLFQHIAKRRKEKKRKDNIISITQRENHHLPLTPVTLKKAIILNSSRHYLGCCAEQRSHRNKKKKQSTGTYCTLMTRKPIFFLSILWAMQKCVYMRGKLYGI